MLELGIITSLHGDLDERFAKIKEMGLTSCQLNNYDPAKFTNEKAQEVLAASEKYGIRVSAIWCGWPGPKFWNFTDGPQTLGLVPEAFRFQRVQCLEKAADFAAETGFSVEGLDYSPIKGPEGNIEYLLYLKKNGENGRLTQETIEQTVQTAHSSL